LGAKRSRMSRTNLFFKVEVEHDVREQPERIGEEIGRQLKKLYGVREVELSNYAKVED
jgi:tetrahydromethanopterin S-methyltransferase subunit G